MDRVRQVVADLQQPSASETTQLTLKMDRVVVAQAQMLASKLGVTRTRLMQELLAAAIADATEELASCGS
jgi:hypothetical protein